MRMVDIIDLTKSLFLTFIFRSHPSLLWTRSGCCPHSSPFSIAVSSNVAIRITSASSSSPPAAGSFPIVCLHPAALSSTFNFAAQDAACPAGCGSRSAFVSRVAEPSSIVNACSGSPLSSTFGLAGLVLSGSSSPFFPSAFAFASASASASAAAACASAAAATAAGSAQGRNSGEELEE